jgi:GAF domain-containing protein
MTATLDDEVADLRRANAELQQRLDEALAERDEALDQQTATTEVLQVINSSPGDLGRVFEAIVEKAHTLCDAASGSVQLWDGENFRGFAMRGFSDAMADRLRVGYSPVDMPCQRIIEGESVVHCPDLAEFDSPTARFGAEVGGVRTILYVALRKDDVLLGQIVAVRKEVRAFTHMEIALVENFAAQAVIAMENARLITETREALEQQTATAEVLQVINSSPGDLAPVFDAMLDKATRLSVAAFGILWTYDGERFQAVAFHNVPPAYVEFLREPQLPSPVAPLGRVARGEAFAHVSDLAAEEYNERAGFLVRQGLSLGGFRTVLAVPMRKDASLLGAITIYRREVQPFSDKQISLLQNFAAQAVIAMENARLITETREALEQQTATAEVLQVINSSPGDLAPVFDAVLEKAMRQCDADFGTFWILADGRIQTIAQRGTPEPLTEFLREPMVFRPGGSFARLIEGEPLLHMADMTVDDEYSARSMRRALVELGNARTSVWVPLRKEGTLIGGFTIYRQEVRPFTDKQIALLQNFAAQAVIAMENARLITETREALDQQTATAEVLGVINSSPGDLAPVFEAILEKAHSLCGAAFGGLLTYEGGRFRAVVLHAAPPAFAEIARQDFLPSPNNPVRRLLAGEPLVHISDLKEIADAAPDETMPRVAVDLGGVRTLLMVPLRKDDALLGVITAYRQEVRPFSEKQIALLQNFAVQAVIAMENARLITETREALEQQTATAEVLQVINASPGDLAPVFEAMLEKARHLCDAAFGSLLTYDGERFHAAALHRVPPGYAQFLQGSQEPGAGTALARVVNEHTVVQVADAATTDNYRKRSPLAVAGVELGGVRTLIVVPLLKDDVLLGVFHLYRQEVRPFTDKQIALLQNFAAQAVIAMENARLITETREALDQQTATSEVLAVINSSPGDLKPVFEAMLEKAMRLCEAKLGFLSTFDGQHFDAVAMYGVPEAYAAEYFAKPYTPASGTTHARIVNGEDVVHVTDLIAEGLDSPRRRAVIEMLDARTILGVALRKDGALLGVLHVYRQEVRPFSEKQIALLQNFAAQAVIAIENARLITETREALEQQTATAEVLQVINSSPGDLGPVFDAMLEKAMRLCTAAFGYLLKYDGERFQTVAHHGLPPHFAEYLPRMDQPGPTGAYARILGGAPLVHITDLTDGDVYQTSSLRQALVDLGGARTGLIVALRKEDKLLGIFTIYRQEVRPFSDKQIALLQNFAAQAVIAMENARLIAETREALEQQTATAEVLQVISNSLTDTQPVFEAIVQSGLKLFPDAAISVALPVEGQVYAVAVAEADSARAEAWRRRFPFPLDRAYMHSAAILDEKLIDIPDVSNALAEFAVGSQNFLASGYRGITIVPMLHGSAAIGALSVVRRAPGPLSTEQVAVLKTFANQAVIAIDNARLLNEIRQRQAELRVTFDNMADGVVMFDAELRLAAWNRNFQELLDLPDVALAERPNYADYLRILAERGEFGTDDIEAELSRRLEGTDQELRLERTRPDGRVIEVRRNAVPDGGFVLIYSDITERKRSEAEIRAARDAAEATLHDLKAAQANLIQAEKMASLGQLTAGIAHEIKNPLNFVNNFAGLSVELLDELRETTAPAVATLDDDQRAEIDETMVMLTGNLEKIVEHGRRADGIVKSMLEHSRGGTGERRSVDLNGLIEEALNLAYHGARAQDQSFNITLEREYGATLKPIEVAPQEITRVFLNLFGNGFYAANKRVRENGDGSFRPSLAVATRDLGDAVEVRIRDNGTGIPTEIRDKLFQPFFTTKPTGEGTGLGLSISYDIITQQHGGTIEVDSRVGEFTEFTIRLPRTTQAASTGTPA